MKADKKIIHKKFIIGITGSFGSGCTTTAKHLESMGYKRISLSDILEEEANKAGRPFNTKKEKQDFGNEIRKNKGKDYLAKKADEKINSDKVVSDKVVSDKVVIECFRNPNEIIYFQEKYYNFYLLAILTNKQEI